MYMRLFIQVSKHTEIQRFGILQTQESREIQRNIMVGTSPDLLQSRLKYVNAWTTKPFVKRAHRQLISNINSL